MPIKSGVNVLTEGSFRLAFAAGQIDAIHTSTGVFLGAGTVNLSGGNSGGCRICSEGSSACPAC